MARKFPPWFKVSTDQKAQTEFVADEVAGKVYKAMMAYAVSDEEPDFDGDGVARLLFEGQRPHIDKSLKEYAAKIKASAAGVDARQNQALQPVVTTGQPVVTIGQPVVTDTVPQHDQWLMSGNHRLTEENRTDKTSSDKTSSDKTSSDKTLKDINSVSEFVPPTVEEIRAYAKEIDSTVDPDHFFDYYSANGWTAGGSRIVNWKAKFRNWSNGGGRNRNAGSVGPNGVALLPESERLHDLDDIIK